MTHETVTLMIDIYTISADNIAELHGALEHILKPYQDRVAVLETRNHELQRLVENPLVQASAPPVVAMGESQLRAERDAARERTVALEEQLAAEQRKARRRRAWRRR